MARKLEVKESCRGMESRADSTGCGNGAGSQSLVDGKRKYKCEICGFDNFNEKSEFVDHFFRHENENQYRFFKFVFDCDECSENFALKEDLLEHVSQKHNK